ncbi:uncharacterized protein LOC117119220 [Anneissia japonica]|uniref:uncharacterized protein LOC117119220 n=1 Tax=Anneissia japonica TaxID=1529436 RepID=UPI00142573A0|nr:uncharacterized protein LOC117119220 [Anneissia japonica]
MYPRISASSNTKVNPGQISTFQCDIQGNVTGVTIQFLIGSQPAAETARTQANGVTRVTFTGEANPTVTYICRLARDPYTAYADHSLNLFALPTYTGQPSSLTVTGSSVELRWRNWSTSSGDGGDGPVIGYVLYYRRSSSSGLWSHMPQDNSLTATVTGLRWEEEYDFAIAAVREGAGGEGPRGSNELTASTATESKCSTGVERYTISYRPVNADVSMITEKTTVDNFYTIMELETYTEYSISVTARNKNFPGMAGVIQVFSPEEVPPVPGVTATHGGSFLNVSVYPSESFSRNFYGNIISFDVRYRSRNSEEWKNQKLTADQGIHGYKISSVVEDAKYKVIARVVNRAGVGNWSPFFTAEHSSCIQSTGTSIPRFMIALVVVLSIIIFLNSLVFCLCYRCNHSNGNNTHKCEVQDDNLATKTRVVEEATEQPNNYTPIAIQHEDQYEVIRTKTQDTYDCTIQQTSGHEEEKIGVTKNKKEPYEIPLKSMGQKSDKVINDIPQYTNIK